MICLTSFAFKLKKLIVSILCHPPLTSVTWNVYSSGKVNWNHMYCVNLTKDCMMDKDLLNVSQAFNHRIHLTGSTEMHYLE